MLSDLRILTAARRNQEDRVPRLVARSGLWQSSGSDHASRQRAGVTPTRRTNAEVKWRWLENPTRSATSAIGAWRSRRFAAAIRRSSTKRYGVTPVACRKRQHHGEALPVGPAAATRLVRLDQLYGPARTEPHGDLELRVLVFRQVAPVGAIHHRDEPIVGDAITTLRAPLSVTRSTEPRSSAFSNTRAPLSQCERARTSAHRDMIIY